MVDVLVDVQYGDCGKGKVSKYLLKNELYKVIAKYNGGGNAGHSVFIDDKEYVAHYLTSGIYNDTCEIIIGPGCVLHVASFLKEIEQFSEFNVKDRVFVHPYCHIITDEHIADDDKDNKIGSTKKGIGPAYSGKYARTNKRAEDIEELKPYVKQFKMFYGNRVLMEGSQGWGLDIDWGNYPYVTSSHIHPAFAFASFAIPMQHAGTIYGVCKPYLTYVGTSDDIVKCSEEDAELIRKHGNEYGKTTGRARKIGYLDMKQLVTAIQQTGVTQLFMNKCDVLEEANVFKFFDMDGKLCTVGSMDSMKVYIEHILFSKTNVNTIYYGHSANSNVDYKKVIN